MANDSVLEKKSDGTTVPSPPIIVPAHKPLSHTAQEISDRIDAELALCPKMALGAGGAVGHGAIRHTSDTCTLYLVGRGVSPPRPKLPV